MFKTCVGCEATRALKKDVHIRRPATAPVYLRMCVWLCVRACMVPCIPVGRRENVTRTESGFNRRLLQNPDSWDKPDSVKKKEKSKPPRKSDQSHQRCEGWGRKFCLSAWVVHNWVNLLRHLDTYFGWEDLNVWPLHRLSDIVRLWRSVCFFCILYTNCFGNLSKCSVQEKSGSQLKAQLLVTFCKNKSSQSCLHNTRSQICPKGLYSPCNLQNSIELSPKL